MVKSIGDVIYDHTRIPVLVINSGAYVSISNDDLLSLAGVDLSGRTNSGELIKGSMLSPGKYFLIKALNAKYALCKILQVDKTQLKIAWIYVAETVVVLNKTN